MQCLWEGCSEILEDNFTQHINHHIEKQQMYSCMWKGCKRYGERQSNKYTLQAHVRKHTNERPFQCTKCEKQYTRSDALNKHLKNHQKVEEETEELLLNINTLQTKQRIVSAELMDIERKKSRAMNEIKIANQKLYECVVVRINGFKEDFEEKPIWKRYLE